ncbi:hypothetical protein ACTNCH_02830 [Candidatus Merdisoma sp. HCP28S3_D10]|uniref:hypothetical protein n=1 Tax=unclassified Candidatus Merdisoma TaxID=3099611 RepID=UPI003F8B2506
MMKTKTIIQNVMYFLIFAGILTANISSILYGVNVSHPVFLAGILLAVFGVNGVLLLKYPSFQIHYISENSSWVHHVD